MKTIARSANLYQLARLGAFNSFLVREDDGFTLVDTGLAGSGRAILAAAQSLGAPIVRILLTHAHVDHVGSLDELHAALPDAPVIIGAREARFLAGDMSLDAAEPQTPLRGGFPKVQTRATDTLHDGDLVGSLRAVAAPGHTPGHLAYYDTRDGTLIAGDAFSTRAGIAVAGVMRLLFPFPAMATWHLPTSLATARRLRALEPPRLAVGHGPVLEAPLAAIDRAIAEASERVEALASGA